MTTCIRLPPGNEFSFLKAFVLQHTLPGSDVCTLYLANDYKRHVYRKLIDLISYCYIYTCIQQLTHVHSTYIPSNCILVFNFY